MFSTTITGTYPVMPIIHYGIGSSWIYPVPLAREEVKTPAERKKTKWRKKRVNAKARNRWEKELERGRQLIVEIMFDLFNGFQPVTIIIANYTLPPSIAGYLINYAKHKTTRLPALSLQGVPRCMNWKTEHSPITDDISIYCKGCRRFFCTDCWEVCPERVTKRIPLSSIGVIERCHNCPVSEID